MSFRYRIDRLVLKLRSVPKKYYFILGVLLVMMLYVVVFREQTLTYHYSGDTCGRRLVLFPSVFSQIGDKGYTITAQGGLKVAGRHIVASSLCVSPLTAPVEDSSKTVAYAPWGGWIARFTYTIETKQHPTVSMAVLEKPIPASRELILPLSEADTTFTYTLTVNNKEAPCNAKGKQIACDLPQLQLAQGSTYQASLKKYFKGESVGEVARSDLETLSPISVIESSIHNDATVYDKPTSVTLGTDKPVRQANITVWRTDGDAPQQLQVSTESKGQEIKVTFAEDLPRQATIELKATLLEATDGSTPLDEKILAFKTAGGPRVTAVNVGASGIGTGTQIVVTFDQELSSDQDLGPLITTSGGVAYQARQSNQLIFSTNGASICGEIAITLKGDIKSPYDISGLSAWQYNGRMRCYTTSVIGYSVQGRPIIAYHFGSSGPSIVYTGAIHGNEVSTKYLMDRWVEELDAYPSKMPASKRVIVVPLINPDGFARGTRVNANNVDLNRNFGVSDWKKDIEDVRGNPFPGGGGTAAMSEPETKAIAGFIAQQRPSLVISYHSTASLAIPNQIGQSGAGASQYASLSGYRLSSGGGGEFGYQITGTADDYYGEQLGIASILIELGSQSYHQFERNQAAMWAMLQ